MGKLKGKKRNKKQKLLKKNKKSKSQKESKRKKKKHVKNRQNTRQDSCGDAFVNNTCIENAVAALDFEKNQIQNFHKQKARVKNQNKTTGNKLGKKGEFKDAAKYLLQALGGNISNPTCGDSGTNSSTRSLKSSLNTYDTLLNCSNSIRAACTMNKDTLNTTIQTKMDTCAVIFGKSKTAATDCRTNSDYIKNGTAACDCWKKAAAGIELAKKEGCTSLTSQTAKNVKKAKNKCLTAF